jgi:hypothetical protein
VEKVSKSVVAVTTRRLEWPGDVGLGTAFAVDRGVYVTAYHVASFIWALIPFLSFHRRTKNGQNSSMIFLVGTN